MSEQPTDDFAEFCEMLRGKLRALAKNMEYGNSQYNKIALWQRTETILTDVLAWIDERFPQEDSERESS